MAAKAFNQLGRVEAVAPVAAVAEAAREVQVVAMEARVSPGEAKFRMGGSGKLDSIHAPTAWEEGGKGDSTR